MNRELIRKIAALRHAHRVNLADQIGDGDIGGGQLLAVAPVARQPDNRHIVAQFLDFVAAGFACRLKGIIVDLAAFYDGDDLVEQVDQAAGHARLGLAALAQKDDVLPGQDGIFNLGDDGIFVAYNTGEDFLPAPNVLNEIFAQLLFHREYFISTFSQLANSARLGSDSHSAFLLPFLGVGTCDTCPGKGLP